MDKKVLITVGGTGGHIFPAMALAQQLKHEVPQIKLLFVGGGLHGNRYFERAAFPHQEVPCGTCSIRKPLHSLRSLWRILLGIKQSRQIIRDFQPDVVVGFGSYHTLPTLIATKLNGVPFILHEANRIPGRVNRMLSPYAQMTGTHFPDTVHMLKGKTGEVKIPLREGYQFGASSKEQARAYFQLEPHLPTILIFGGSQGAQAINRLVSAAIPLLPQHHLKTLQILHLTGDVKVAQQLRDHYRKHGVKAMVKEFESRMDLAWQSADLMISRAGAVTLAEQVEFEVPGVLIPFPFAMDNHQESNADFMVDVVKGAVKCVEKGLSPIQLAEVIAALLADDGEQLREMQYAIHRYRLGAKPYELCALVKEMME